MHILTIFTEMFSSLTQFCMKKSIFGILSWTLLIYCICKTCQSTWRQPGIHIIDRT